MMYFSKQLNYHVLKLQSHSADVFTCCCGITVTEWSKGPSHIITSPLIWYQLAFASYCSLFFFVSAGVQDKCQLKQILSYIQIQDIYKVFQSLASSHSSLCYLSFTNGHYSCISYRLTLVMWVLHIHLYKQNFWPRHECSKWSLTSLIRLTTMINVK